MCGILHLCLFLSGGSRLVSYLPKCSIAGCLLLPSGLDMVRTALVDQVAFSTFQDYCVTWLISCTILVADIQTGLLLGFGLNTLQLMVQCAHFKVIRSRESMKDIRTVKDRSCWTRSF